MEDEEFKLKVKLNPYPSLRAHKAGAYPRILWC